MNLSLTGTPDECTVLIGLLADLAAAGVLAEVGSPSGPHRLPSDEMRVDLHLRVPTTTLLASSNDRDTAPWTVIRDGVSW